MRLTRLPPTPFLRCVACGLFAAVTTACHGTAEVIDLRADGGRNSASGDPAVPSKGDPAVPSDGDGGVAAVPALTPKAECERYLECINQSSPEEGGAAVALYGDASPCWKGSSADAQRCGDACHVARVAIPNIGKKKAPACGCTSDTECKDSFCGTTTGSCALPEWADALATCKLVESKTWTLSQPPMGSCYAIDGLRCDGIKTLLYLGSQTAADADGTIVSVSSLQKLYDAARAATELKQLGTSLNPPLPSDAPASCRGQSMIDIYQVPETDSPNTFDLLSFRSR